VYSGITGCRITEVVDTTLNGVARSVAIDSRVGVASAYSRAVAVSPIKSVVVGAVCRSQVAISVAEGRVIHWWLFNDLLVGETRRASTVVSAFIVRALSVYATVHGKVSLKGALVDIGAGEAVTIISIGASAAVSTIIIGAISVLTTLIIPSTFIDVVAGTRIVFGRETVTTEAFIAAFYIGAGLRAVVVTCALVNVGTGGAIAIKAFITGTNDVGVCVFLACCVGVTSTVVFSARPYNGSLIRLRAFISGTFVRSRAFIRGRAFVCRWVGVSPTANRKR
jgi:hypothetical protein